MDDNYNPKIPDFKTIRERYEASPKCMIYIRSRACCILREKGLPINEDFIQASLGNPPEYFLRKTYKMKDFRFWLALMENWDFERDIFHHAAVACAKKEKL